MTARVYHAPGLRLWLLSRKGVNYDEHGGFVIAAGDEADARAIALAQNSEHSPTWSDEGATVECIGTAAPNVARGIVLEDFRAG